MNRHQRRAHASWLRKNPQPSAPEQSDLERELQQNEQDEGRSLISPLADRCGDCGDPLDEGGICISLANEGHPR